MKRYQLKISLRGSNPLIWRRVIVKSSLFLEGLHWTIQSVMPWYSGHIDQFIKDKEVYGLPSDDEWENEEIIDYTNLTVADLLTSEKDKISYVYDLGDYWLHDIVVEKVLPDSDDEPTVIYLDGANACPPDDCGGMPAYQSLLKILDDPSHPQYEDMRDWLDLGEGENYDPKELGIDPEAVNQELANMFDNSVHQ